MNFFPSWILYFPLLLTLYSISVALTCYLSFKTVKEGLHVIHPSLFTNHSPYDVFNTKVKIFCFELWSYLVDLDINICTIVILFFFFFLTELSIQYSSWNCRLTEVRRDHSRLSCPIFLLNHSHMQNVAQDHNQMAFEYPQGGRLCNLHGKSVLELSQPP